MISREEYDCIINGLLEREKRITELGKEITLSFLEDKTVFLVRSVKEDVFGRFLIELSKEAPNCKLYVLGRIGDEEILKRQFRGDFTLYVVSGDERYDVSNLSGISDKLNKIKFDACLFMGRKKLGINQANLMRIVDSILCAMRGVVMENFKIYGVCMLEELEAFEDFKLKYDRVLDEIWENT